MATENKRYRWLTVSLAAILAWLPWLAAAQVSAPIKKEVRLEVDGASLAGLLTLPDTVGRFPLVIVIAGSGPTDMDGNNPLGVRADTYKMIGDSLAAHQIATLRYDKRGIGQSSFEGTEADMVLQVFVYDAIAWVKHFEGHSRFSDVAILGHSEGALIGSLVVQQLEEVAAFVSVAGSATKFDQLLLNQLEQQGATPLLGEARRVLDSLNAGKTVSDVGMMLQSLFRPSVQPFLISLLKHDPLEEFAKVPCPVLVIHGSTDLQVAAQDARQLAASHPNARLEMVEGMNHVLKQAPSSRYENMMTYSNPNLPLPHPFVKALVSFLQQNME